MADYIHHDPDRILYSVSEEELDTIIEHAQPLWKDICLVSFSIGIPSLINAIAGTKASVEFHIDLTLFLNYLFGSLGIVLGIVFAIAWHQSYRSPKKLIDKIKARPKMALAPTTSDVGALDEIKAEVEELKNKPATWG